MTDNIKPLFGDTHPQIYKHGEPNQELVEMLEEFLEQARSGHMRAMAYACVSSERSLIYSWVGSADQTDMLAAISKLNHHFLRLAED